MPFKTKAEPQTFKCQILAQSQRAGSGHRAGSGQTKKHSKFLISSSLSPSACEFGNLSSSQRFLQHRDSLTVREKSDRKETVVWICGAARVPGLAYASSLSLGYSGQAVAVLSPVELLLQTGSPTLVLQKVLEAASQVSAGH